MLLHFLCWRRALREKCPNTEFFLVHIFLYSDQKILRIWILFTHCRLSGTQCSVIKDLSEINTFLSTVLNDIVLSLLIFLVTIPPCIHQLKGPLSSQWYGFLKGPILWVPWWWSPSSSFFFGIRNQSFLLQKHKLKCFWYAKRR